MMASDKTKISPRDTYIFHDSVHKNNSEWAEIYKLGGKLVNKPQLVKFQDLILLQTSGRAAKQNAKSAIRDMIPYIGAAVRAMVPAHSWSYQQLLDLYNSGEMEYEEILE